jgi:hypothetical protein
MTIKMYGAKNNITEASVVRFLSIDEIVKEL